MQTTTEAPTLTHAITHRITGAVLFECEVPADLESGLRTRYVLERATKERADLRGADLSDADLRGADLRGADLSDAYLSDAERATDEQAIANLDKVREVILDDTKRLEMGHWHADESTWQEKSCAEEMLCGTTHCLAGWLQVCSTDPKVRAMAPDIAGIVQAPVAAKMFYRGADEVLGWLTDRKYVVELDEANMRRAERAAKKAGAQ